PRLVVWPRARPRFRQATRPGSGPALGRPGRRPARFFLRPPASAARPRARSRLGSCPARLAFASDEAVRARLLAAGGADRAASAGTARRLAPARLRTSERRSPPPALLGAAGGTRSRRARSRQRHPGDSGADWDPADPRPGQADV